MRTASWPGRWHERTAAPRWPGRWHAQTCVCKTCITTRKAKSRYFANSGSCAMPAPMRPPADRAAQRIPPKKECDWGDQCSTGNCSGNKCKPATTTTTTTINICETPWLASGTPGGTDFTRRRTYCSDYPRRRNAHVDEWCWGPGLWLTCGDLGVRPFTSCKKSGNQNPLCFNVDKCAKPWVAAGKGGNDWTRRRT